jgi:glutamate synthase domain-containing protein 1
MCGIAGLILERPGNIGQLLVQMLDGCQHRGPDSTGFAFYHEQDRGVLICRIYLGCQGESPKAHDLERKVLAIIAGHGGQVVSKRFQQEHLRLELNYHGDVKPLCYAIENDAGVEIFSIGRGLEIIKDIGTAAAVNETYNLSTFRGTHGIGHVRLATESNVDVSRAHPFWAYGFKDVAIVHNGQITNYHKMMRQLVRRGYQFRTDNDSELIAVYLADKLASGRTLDAALEESVGELDGTFSFLVSTLDGIGFAKDTLAAKPMVVLEHDHTVAVASEEVSLQRLFPGQALSTYEPFPGTFKTWSKSTPETKA